MDRGSGAAVVEVHEVRADVGPLGQPQHVACVAIAMQAKRSYLAGSGECAAHAGERELDNALIRRDEIGRNEAVREEPVSRLLAETLDVQSGPLAERRSRADGVDPADEASQPFARRAVLELGGTAAAVPIHRKAVAAERVQRAIAR